ncbi:bifunctional DNA primase/polymerase [Hansschlegelia sp. KR7-227]|uniref:bifunctional DNA primase/polymerase n=1 Tax=Hansschlegelia sp. KR7-227 TaxID=3400914 RepID=UPI003BFFC9AB
MLDLREYFANRRKEGEEPIIVTSEQIGESFFSVYGPLLLEKGWSTYPQERTGRRLPARIEGEVIAWSQYQTERPSKAMGAKWSLHSPTSNVAVIMGPSSGNAIAIDVDVTDEELSVQIENLATTILGDTEYRRIGNAPKIMMFYRFAETASFNKRTLRLAVEDDETVASEHMVEILAKNSTVTFYGRHHSTGARFQWLEHPAKVSPEALIVITEAQLAQFEEALGKLRAIYKPTIVGYGVELGDLPATPDAKRSVKVGNHSDWTADPVTGLITDGREKYVNAFCFELVRVNPAKEYSRQDRAELARLAFDAIAPKIDRGGWGDNFLLREINSKIALKTRDLAAGRITPSRGDRKARPVTPAGVFDRMEGSRLAELIGPQTFKPRFNPTTGEAQFTVVPKTPEQVEADRIARALPTDRSDIFRVVAAAPLQAAHDFMAAIERHREEKEKGVVTGTAESMARWMQAIILAPGSGKTTNVGTGLATIMQDEERRHDGRIMFSVKTKRLVGELADKLLNAGRKLQAEGLPGVEILDYRSPIPTGPSAKVRIGIATGKASCVGEMGCPYAPLFQRLSDNDLSGAGLCESKNEDGSVSKCTIWMEGRCGYKNLKAILATCQIVIAPAAYLTMAGTPKSLKERVVGLVVDEDPTLALAREYNIRLEDLVGAREGRVSQELSIELGWKKPRKGEKAEPYPISTDDAAAYRQQFGRMVCDALAAGKDAAQVLLDYRDPSFSHLTGRVLYLAAKACVSRSDAVKIEPNMALEKLTAVLDARPKGGRGRTAERALVKVIGERMEMIEKDRLAHKAWALDLLSAENHVAMATKDIPEVVLKDLKKKVEDVKKARPRALARGAADARLQLRDPDAAVYKATQEHNEREQAKAARQPGYVAKPFELVGLHVADQRYSHLRISRRMKLNWADVPCLLLDASANMKLVEKAFGRTPTPVRVPVIPHQRVALCVDRSYSDYQILPRGGDNAEQIAAKEANVRRIRLALAMNADFAAPGRQLFTATKKVLKVVKAGWRAPDNLDTMHYGDVRGRDGAKNHVGLMPVGRSQFPISTNDALAAAYGYDDEVPPQPYDLRGDGLTIDDKGNAVELFRVKEDRVVRLRNGHDVIRKVPSMPEGYGRWIDEGWRDQEMAQTIGRPRCIYRTADSVPPTIMIHSTAVPDDVIVDELFSDDAMVKHSAPAEARRLAGRIVSTEPALDPEEDRHSAAGALNLEIRFSEMRAKNPSTPTEALLAQAKAQIMGEWRATYYPWLRWLDPAVFSCLDDDAQIERITGRPAWQLDQEAAHAWARSRPTALDYSDAVGPVARRGRAGAARAGAGARQLLRKACWAALLK